MPAAGDGEARRRLPRAWRVTNSAEIRAVLQRGKRSRTAHLDVFDSSSPLPHPRVGVVVPKHRHNSVQRNRLKRRIREIVRLEILPRLAQNGVNVEILIRARREAYEAAFAILRTELITWVERRWQLDSCSS